MNQRRVLIVEDDEGLREALIDTIAFAGYQWLEAASAEEALLLLKNEPVDLVISDIQMTGMDGLSLLRSIKQNYPQLPVLLMTAYANIQDAVAAMKEGAIDYMAKPFAPEVLLNLVSRYAVTVNDPCKAIVADDKSQKLLSLAKRVAKTDASVLVLGPSGSGKEVMSRFIHDSSERKNGPFVAINCAAIPDNMLEATLFGYEKGAFTGAVKACPGKFEQAQGGTILLDEISEMDLNLQAKLLRVIQEREVERLGSRKSISLDVRILATSNRDLKQYVREGNFREDLYYRLNVFPLIWPALAERPGDISPLALHFLEKHCKNQGISTPAISAEAMEKLRLYHWPGNVRELDNVMQRALILSRDQIISAADILLEGVDWLESHSLQDVLTEQTNEENNVGSHSSPCVIPSESLGLELREQEFSIILETIRKCDGRRKDVAEILGISPRTLRYKLAKMRDAGIEIPV